MAQPTQLQVFIEKLGVFFGVENRMPRSVARVLAFLLVSEPTQQTAEQIAESLKMSTGSVSTAVNLLLQVGLIKRVGVPGQRKFYYESDPNGWRHAMVQRLKSVHHGVALAEEGMQLANNPASLKAMRDTYAIFESEVETLIKRLNQTA